MQATGARRVRDMANDVRYALLVGVVVASVVSYWFDYIKDNAITLSTQSVLPQSLSMCLTLQKTICGQMV